MEKYLLYGKFGAVAIFTPKYADELNESTFTINYKNSFGGQIGIGLMRRIESEKVFFYIELNHIFAIQNEWESALSNDVDEEPSN